jgi:beta-aspartyl-peptidase (threonine type)
MATTDGGAEVVLAVHGGAGAIPGERHDEARAALRAALQAGGAVLGRGGAAIDAVQAAVQVMEEGGAFNAGKGAVRASDGSVSLDAAVMEGAGRRAGAVAALTGFPGAVAAARLVCDRTSHVLLAGPGAEAFAAAQGLARVDPGYFVRPGVAARSAPGTVGAVAVDRRGGLAAATSTGGISGKLPGRVGDSPIVGAGTWADARCAISATGDGELFIRAVFAYRIATLVEAGVPLDEATRRALDEVVRLGGAGGCVALTAEGAAAMTFVTPGMSRGTLDRAGAIRVAIGPEAPG